MNAPITPDQLEAAHWLVVGTTGSGKTYLARGLLEQLRRADRRVGAIDKLGKLWGLILAADGEGPGLEFVIFGGKRAQVPMSPGDGEKLGRLFVTRNIPAIFDLSQWRASDQERWVAAFATAAFAANETALHLLVDEAQAWVPQGGGGVAYEAVRLLAEQGRGNGINLLLTAPRLSGLDANVRGAIGAMVAMRQTSDVDSKRTAELVAGHLAIDARAVRAELPSLPTGTGFVWSPTGAGLERVAFPENTTFDSSRTPRHGDTPPAPTAVSSALVDELRAALAPPDPTVAVEQAEARSADELGLIRANAECADVITQQIDRIADLEQQLADAKRIGELLYRRGIVAGIARARDALAGLSFDTAEVPPIEEAGAIAADFFANRTPISAAGETPRQRAEDVPSTVAPGDSAAAGGASDLPPRHVRILGAIAWAAAYLKRESVPRAIVAWIAEVSASSSSFSNDLGALRSSGLISYPAKGELALTDAGTEAAPFVKRARTRDELWGAISAKLPPRQIAIVDALWGGDDKRRERLASDVGVSATSSSFSNDLGRLRSLGLIDYPAPALVALAELLR